MITRTVGVYTYSLSYDAENRLTNVKQKGVVTATLANTTTFYADGHYEQTGSTVRNHYYHAGKRIAMREVSTLYWLLGDQLGSTDMFITSTGVVTGELRYKAWGEIRYTSGVTPTKYRFTGQREESTIGLYFYSARWYDPVLGRFVQADAVVPQPGNPQSLNRYSYVLNNPLKYVDSSGHAIDDGYGILRRYTSGGELRAVNLSPPGTSHSDRDLTYFAVMEAHTTAASKETGEIASANRKVFGKPSAYSRFRDLVADGRQWDIKDRMRFRLGESFDLSGSKASGWYEYSTLGNILYGYTGTEAGFRAIELRIGAGYAEMTDPDNRSKRSFPPCRPAIYLPANRLQYLGDEQHDYSAVSMGIEMSRRYGANVTVQQFQAQLTKYQDRLASGTPSQSPVSPGGWPYTPGDFDNR